MLNARSKQVRRDAIAISKVNGGYHYGGSFSCAEILVALYDSILGKDDKFILSKGHGCWVYYVLLRERGFNPLLEGHPHYDPHNGIYCTTGSMGHGLPVGMGIAQAKRMKGDPGRVFVLMGDGECQEGTTWESLLIAGRLKLDNLVAIVDDNKIQGSDFVDNVIPIRSPVAEAARSAGWTVLHKDGHNDEILEWGKSWKPDGKPVLIIADTIKGKGVSFMEGSPKWHSNWLGGDFEKKAMEELQ